MRLKTALFTLTVGFFAFMVAAANWAKSAPEKKIPPANAKIESAIFAGGCFWCVEANFEKVDGVLEAVSGYTGGHKENPTYKQVCSHTTGHLEAVKVTYDSNQVTYNDLLEVFWRTVDPTDAGGQFADRGEPYMPAIFVANETQRQIAKASKQRLTDSGRFKDALATPIRDAAKFYVAEDYHQDYYHTHPLEYKAYRYGSGRDHFIAKVWGNDAHYHVAKKETMASPASQRMWANQPRLDCKKPSQADLRQQLSSIQFQVTQHDVNCRSRPLGPTP